MIELEFDDGLRLAHDREPSTRTESFRNESVQLELVAIESIVEDQNHFVLSLDE